MPDPLTPQSGTSAAAPIEVIDEASAAQAIEGLFDSFGNIGADDGDDPGQSREPQDSAQAEDGDGESHPTGEEDTGHSEAEGQSASRPIEPPKSWSDEHKKLFSELPPAAQQVIAQRETEREAAFTRGQKEIADQKRATDTAHQAITTERQQYQQNLQTLARLVTPELQQLQQVDWVRLSQENPAEYVRFDGMRKALEMRLGAVQREFAAGEQRAAAEQHQRQTQVLESERQRLIEREPLFADAEKGPKLIGELRTWLGKEGFSPDEIGVVSDHRLVSLALKAMRADLADAARKSAATKVATPTPPRVAKPGTPQQATDSKTRQARESWASLQRTGSDRDARRLIELAL